MELKHETTPNSFYNIRFRNYISRNSGTVNFLYLIIVLCSHIFLLPIITVTDFIEQHE